MSLLSIVGNPRRRRRKKAARRRTRRAKATTHRRRRVANPRRRRRVHAARHHRRRRHRNPASGGGSVTPQAFVKALTGVGVGVIAASALSSVVKNTVLKDKAADPMVGLLTKAAVGIVGGMVVGKYLKQRALGTGIMTGAAALVALDVYKMYIEPNLPAQLHDYQYGSIQGWAPQPGLTPAISAYQQGTLQGENVYDGGVYD